ncbi:MAG TPA: 50S ribosomal protein L18 [Candidatus Krumholzibacteria bacterium]|jgi:large subunit ribosomal protein L18|nr:50S ribosomal protein L18 [Candidatus Krumholzibacteria bacterium]
MQKKFRNENVYKRWRRHKRVRNRVSGTPERPRLAVFRSNAHIYAQLIDDTAGVTLLSMSSLKIDASAAAAAPKAEGKKSKKSEKAEGDEAKAAAAGRKIELAREVGRQFAQAAQAKGFKKAAFDRGGYLYHGRVAALAEGAREAGLDF